MSRPPVASTSIRYAGVVALAAAILYASIIEPGGVPRTFLGVGVTVYLHLAAYGGLSAALGYAVLAADRRTLLGVALVATAYGACIELLQGTIPHRTMAGSDVIVNAVGAAIGAGLWRVLAPRFGVVADCRSPADGGDPDDRR